MLTFYNTIVFQSTPFIFCIDLFMLCVLFTRPVDTRTDILLKHVH